MRRRLTLVAALICLAALLAAVRVANVSSSDQVNQVFTSTVTFGSSVSMSLLQPRQVFSGAFTVLSTTGTNLPCEFWTLNFTAADGQSVSGNVTSDNPISVYVIQETSYSIWLKNGSCGNTVDAIASQLITTSYSFNAVIPTSGIWLIVLVNSSNAKNADGYLSVYLSSGTYTATQPLTSTVIETIPTTPATTMSGQPTGVAGFPISSIIVGITIGLIAVAFLRRKKRG